MKAVFGIIAVSVLLLTAVHASAQEKLFPKVTGWMIYEISQWQLYGANDGSLIGYQRHKIGGVWNFQGGWVIEAWGRHKRYENAKQLPGARLGLGYNWEWPSGFFLATLGYEALGSYHQGSVSLWPRQKFGSAVSGTMTATLDAREEYTFLEVFPTMSFGQGLLKLQARLYYGQNDEGWQSYAAGPALAYTYRGWAAFFCPWQPGKTNDITGYSTLFGLSFKS